jgi:hypothetical protein
MLAASHHQALFSNQMGFLYLLSLQYCRHLERKMGRKIPKQWGSCIRLDFEVEEVEGSRAFVARGRKKETGRKLQGEK